MSDPIDHFLPAVRRWFLDTFAQPTPPQALGWPAIQRREHTLILSPTGSGKTLAAFLWGIDQLFRERIGTAAVELAQSKSLPAHSRPPAPATPDDGGAGEGYRAGVRLLYVSPLKALNNDVQRNLRTPLAGIRRISEELGEPLPHLEVLVRTGDTPQSLRRQMVKDPPPILITTPESLYLLLTSPVARGMFRTVRTVIVDEIHTLVGNKRGVHLALSLERVAELACGPVQRIGLSATQRPLDEVARFLGGFELPLPVPPGPAEPPAADADDPGGIRPVPRPVTVVDAGLVKPMDLRVVTAVEDFSQLPGGSIWPAAIPQMLDLIESHQTTLVFANSRRQAERAADRLNEVWLARQAGEGGGPEALGEGGAVKGQGFLGTGAVGGPFRAHHGSVSRESRLELEHALKEGRLPALVGTSSLELGIDIGAVDLVVQLQSPKGVAQGLQRVGRSGHLVGQTSKGRIFVTHREDLLESAAIARAMLEGDVEPSSTPQNCLDVLAQQIVAMVGVEDWTVSGLFRLVRRAYPYHALTYDLFCRVLDMLAGRYPSSSFRDLRPRIAWDRVHSRLTALPASRLIAIRNGGTIPDRGSFGAYLPDRKTRLGELDEEFVFETRPGDIFTLGASTWRVQEVTEDRVIVSPAPGHMPRMPFWRGDALRRDYYLGQIYGRFRRELAERVAEPEERVIEWLQEGHALDINSARNAVGYVRHQIEVLGAISTDRTVVAELFTDPLGDLRLVIHSCFGSRVNSPWALALAQAFREELGSRPEVMVSDDGILFRFLEADRDPPLHLVREMGAAEARERVLAELPNSALFGAQFRMNAARALLLPAAKGREKRTPFWLQRLRAKDLLAAAEGLEDFPIIAETFRDCLRDVLDLAHLEEVLSGIHRGEIQVVTAETVVPSPVAAGLLFELISQYMYEGDQPKAEQQMHALMVGRETLVELLEEASLPELLRPEAVRDLDGRLQHLADGTRARTAEELAVLFLALGDLSAEEALARAEGDGAPWLAALVDQGRLLSLGFRDGPRLVLAEQAATYEKAFGVGPSPCSGRFSPSEPSRGEQSAGADLEERADARREVLRRVLSTHGPLARDWLLARYPWEAEWLDAALASLADGGEVVCGRISPGVPSGATECSDRRNLERIHRQTLALLRKEVEPVNLYAYADFLTRWQHLHPAERLSGPGALVRLLEQMRGVPAPGMLWERDLLPLRLGSFDPRELEELCGRGDLVWVGSGGRDPRRARVRFFFRGEGSLFLGGEPAQPELTPAARELFTFLKAEGASFTADLEAGTALAKDEVSAALVELVMTSLVSNDTLQALRQVLSWSAAAGEDRTQLSSLAAELAAWRDGRGQEGGRAVAWPRPRYRPVRRSVHAARGPAARRVERALVPRWPGRWGLVHRIGVWGRDLPAEERIERQARQLLHCFGVVTRESVALLEDDGVGEKGVGGLAWEALYGQFQRMEMRGEVRRGYFVKGLPGVQFALPEALERLREWTRPEAAGSRDLVLIVACDPANPFGPSLPGEPEQANEPARFLRIPGNYLVLLCGRPVLLLEAGSERVTSLPGFPMETLRRALKLAVEHICRVQRRLTLKEWNAEPLLGSRWAPLAEGIGFRREALVYVAEW